MANKKLRNFENFGENDQKALDTAQNIEKDFGKGRYAPR